MRVIVDYEHAPFLIKMNDTPCKQKKKLHTPIKHCHDQFVKSNLLTIDR